MQEVLLEPALPSRTGSIRRKVEAAKRIGRPTSKFQFTLTARSLTGLPLPPKCSAIALQLSRGRGKTVTTEAVRTDTGSVSWNGAVLLINATLRQSHTGKGFSNKAYRVSLVGVFEKRLRELARTEINLSAFAGATMPTSHSLQLVAHKRLLGGVKSPPVLSLEVAALEISSADDANDDDDDTSSRCSEGSRATWRSYSVASSDGCEAEQDLHGFEPSRSPALLPIGEDASLRYSSVEKDGMRELNASVARIQVVGSTRDVAPSAAGSGGTERVLWSGWLDKQAVSAPTLLKNWRRRFVVLHPTRLTWSKQEGGKPANSLPVVPPTKVTLQASNAKLVSVRTDSRELLVKAATEQQAEALFAAVQQAVQSSVG
ncbi:hypothetical protein AB1Y20_012436 [Prymnesium parvum]|uniref:C2 NT-type domain-containing protein n=1 Tax=Prymnesium parvum TaxID=97485 RepID=A0AB34IHV8_PRYPA